MITRYAIFGGQVKAGKEVEMRAWVTDHLTPLWRKFACAEEVCVLFGMDQDADGPNIPLILAITYADRDAMEKGVTSPARHAAKALLPDLYDQFYDKVELWHYLMDREQYFD
jgi:quinol monooxygenase YgiN